MNKIGIFALAILLVSTFAPLGFALGPVQPPVDTTTLYSGTIAWGPRYADPARAYDTGSGELIFNAYDTLITYGSTYANAYGTWHTDEEYYFFEPMIATNVPDRAEVTLNIINTGINTNDPVCYWWQVGSTWYHIEGWVDNNANGVLDVGDVLYIGEYTAEGMNIAEATTARTWRIRTTGSTWIVYHFYYDFNMRTSPVISFYDSTGAVVGTLGMDDLVYTFQRALAKDESGSPVWMYYKPFFDQMDSTGIVDHNAPDHDAAWLLAKLIGDAIQDMGGNVLRMNVGIEFADVGFKQVLAQTWGSIMDKGWTVARSLFNGNLYEDIAPADGIPDWIITALKHAEPFRPALAANYAGSGPYLCSVVDSAANLVVLTRNPNYWRGWPAPGRKAFLEHINIEFIALWTPRRDAFVASQLDVAAVPRSNMQEIMTPQGEPANAEIKTIKNISPSLSMDSMFFTMSIDPNSTSLYTKSLPDGIPYNFLNNTHVRKAFSYAFDRALFLTQAWGGEAIVRETPAIFGLQPDYYNYGPDPPWTYTKNIPQVIAELQAAFMPGDPVSVWDHGGFKLDMFYNSGNEPRRIACEIIQATFNEINTANGKNFIINIQAPDWPTFLNNMEAMTMPVWQIGWLADYADASNWFGPYMHSYGDFTYYQAYSAANGWDATPGARTGIVGKDEMIDLAFKTPDGTLRRDLYNDLNDIYVNEDPNLPTSQPLGRRWAKYWVKGWYFNTLYPSQYYYHMYKENACWADVTSATVGIPDGRTDMRDIGYIAGHFGAKAPDTARTPPYDPKWAPGTYGMAGCDVYGDRKVDMRDIGFAASHFGHQAVP